MNGRALPLALDIDDDSARCTPNPQGFAQPAGAVLEEPLESMRLLPCGEFRRRPTRNHHDGKCIPDTCCPPGNLLHDDFTRPAPRVNEDEQHLTTLPAEFANGDRLSIDRMEHRRQKARPQGLRVGRLWREP